MNDHKTVIGNICTIFSWMFSLINPAAIPIVLSSVASVMAIINYWYSIKKNKKP